MEEIERRTGNVERAMEHIDWRTRSMTHKMDEWEGGMDTKMDRLELKMEYKMDELKNLLEMATEGLMNPDASRPWLLLWRRQRRRQRWLL